MKREIYYIPILPDTAEDRGLNPEGLIEIAEYKLYTEQEMKNYIAFNYEQLMKSCRETIDMCKEAISVYDKIQKGIEIDKKEIKLPSEFIEHQFLTRDLDIDNYIEYCKTIIEECEDTLKLPPEYIYRFIAVERWVVDDEVKDALSRLGECCANVLELYEADKEFEENFNRITDAIIVDEEDY